MKPIMQYKGYYAKIEYDDEDKVFHGRVLGINDVVNFEGDCVQDLNEAFKDSVIDYLEFCKERGQEPQKSFSGKFEVRLDPELHGRLYLRAVEEGKSINKVVNEVLLEQLA
jgi:predicted HicB family RNase H-like nuclease